MDELGAGAAAVTVWLRGVAWLVLADRVLDDGRFKNDAVGCDVG